MSDARFSDSEDEAEPQDIGYEAELVADVPKDEHDEIVADKLEQINRLTEELAIVKESAQDELSRVSQRADEERSLFKKERESHLDEMNKRQNRINYLMDKLMSK